MFFLKIRKWFARNLKSREFFQVCYEKNILLERHIFSSYGDAWEYLDCCFDGPPEELRKMTVEEVRMNPIKVRILNLVNAKPVIGLAHDF